ncbi:MAG: hypothetical protein JSR66_20025 [Proteobacteria bacterium]|nr:hypothetical protein [Pseudomonadota bacterium]
MALNKQRDCLRALVSFEGSLTELQLSFRDVPYDYEGEVVTLTCAHLARGVRRYLDNEVSASDLQAWADMIEGRPGIEYESSRKDILDRVLCQLSMPYLNEPISPQLCWCILKVLRAPE